MSAETHPNLKQSARARSIDSIVQSLGTGSIALEQSGSNNWIQSRSNNRDRTIEIGDLEKSKWNLEVEQSRSAIEQLARADVRTIEKNESNGVECLNQRTFKCSNAQTFKPSHVQKLKHSNFGSFDTSRTYLTTSRFGTEVSEASQN